MSHANLVKVAEGHGAGAWVKERLTSLVLVPLGLWALWSAAVLSDGGYDGAVAWIGRPVNAWLLGITLLVSVWHLHLGLRVIVEDYIHRKGSLRALLVANTLFCVLLAAAGVFFIVRAALGSAPLSAGLGV